MLAPWLRVAFAGVLLAAPLETAPDQSSPRFPKGLSAMELGPPPGLADWSQARCASCHPREARAWALSGHATARTNFLFQAALTRDRPGWCLRCHAPLARDPQPGPVAADAPAEERGITCAACHAGHAAVVSPQAASAPHAIEVVSHSGGSALCAQCHEFGFATQGVHGEIRGLSGGPPQQDTFHEWSTWQARTGDARGCLSCHGGDHSFGGVHRTDRVAAAVQVATEPGALVLRTRDVGHALPTGDIMRWLSVEAAAEPLFESPLELARFGRELGLAHDSDGTQHKTVTHDRRLWPGEPVRIEVPRTDGKGRALVAWRIVYHLESAEQEATAMVPAQSSRIVVASGYLKTEPK